MPIGKNPGGSGASGPDLTSANAAGVTYYGPTFRANTSSGKYTLEEFKFGAWKPAQVTSLYGTKLATSVETGVGSFHLGSVHSLSSGGQDMTVTNHVTGVAWSPVWQGMSADGNTLYPPSIRVPGAKVTLEPNGALIPASTPIDYAVSITAAANTTFIDLAVMPAESSATGGWWVCEYSSGLVEIARIALPSWTADTELKMAFGNIPAIPNCAPLSIRIGETIDTYIVRADTGAKMKCRQGTTTATPWRRVSSRPFTDSAILTNQGTQTPTGMELTGYPDGANYTINQGVSINTNGVKYDFPDRVITAFAIPTAAFLTATAINLGDAKALLASITVGNGTGPIVALIAQSLLYVGGGVTGKLNTTTIDLRSCESILGTLELGTTSGNYALLDISKLKILNSLNVTGPLNTLPTLSLVASAFSVSVQALWLGTSVAYNSHTKITSFSCLAPNCTSASFLANTGNPGNVGAMNLSYGGGLTTVIAPLITSISLTIAQGTATSITLPVNATSLTGINSIYPVSTNLTTLNLSQLSGFLPGLTLAGCPALTTLNISNFTSIGDKGTNGCAMYFDSTCSALTSFAIPAGVLSITGPFDVSGLTIPAAQIDAMFIKLASLDGTAGTTLYQNKAVKILGTNRATATSLTARNLLIARGCTVTA
jgi:hypothetical protein